MNAFIKILDHMEDLLLGSTNIPFTPWVMVNADRLLPLMDRLREQLPHAIQDAQNLVNAQEALLEEARQQAIQLLQNAEHERHQILSESELMCAIQEEAQRVRTQMINELNALKADTLQYCEDVRRSAEEEAEEIRYAAKAYASEMLNTVDARLGELHQHLRSGVKQLNATTPPVSTQPMQEDLVRRTMMPALSAPRPMPNKTTKRQPRPKVASQQKPLVSSASPEEQIQLAMQLLQQNQR
jgi:F0F1-type ATP synthase membrane subunit b/b'